MTLIILYFISSHLFPAVSLMNSVYECSWISRPEGHRTPCCPTCDSVRITWFEKVGPMPKMRPAIRPTRADGSRCPERSD